VVFRNRRIAVDERALWSHRASIAFVAALTAILLTVALVPTASAELPIPQLALWEAHMLSFGQTHCYLGTLDQVYYDAERVYYQIADYTGDPSWTTCAQFAQAVYRDQYVFPNNGGVPGYWNFTTGLRMDYQRTGDAQSKNAAILLSQKGAYAPDATPLAWTATAERSREVAYTIVSYINAEALGEPKRQRRIDLVNQAYGHMDEWFVDFSWPGPWQQSPQTTIRLSPFMVGLTAHALIRDWEETGDARLLPALRRAADWMWANAWIPSAQAMWYEFPSQGLQCCQASAAAPDLNLLIAPLYAFLYRQTGETKYRDQGDQLFAGGITGAYLNGGKQFDQNYWWSFDYVTWRLAAPASNPVPSLTSVAPSSAAAGTAGLLLTVSGSNFVPNSVVQWNGTSRTTTFVSSTQLQATILATDIAAAGTAQVTVLNPAPGGGTSTARTFTISPSFAVSVVKAGTGSGTVTSAPAGVSCGSNCSARFASGTSVVLTATPDANSTFGSWSGCDTVVGTQCTVVLTATKTVTATFQPIADTTRPTVSITTPASGATLTGIVTVSATATDNVGVVGVQFKLDGTNLGAEDTAAPYSVSWNTASVPNGVHTITAVARDAAGNSTTSAAVTVTVSNATLTFTDDPLTPQNAVVKAVHVTELRAAIDSIRVARGLAPFAWTDPTLAPGNTPVKAVHLTELRTVMNQAYQAAGRTPPTYTDPAGPTVIKAIQVNELRSAVRALW
jgi:hypothetical protein